MKRLFRAYGRAWQNADRHSVYTTPAPKGTLSNAAINGARRATENLSRPTTSSDAANQRQSSAPLQQRPASSSSPKTSSPLAPNAPSSTPTIRTSLVNDFNPPNPSYSSMNMQSPVMNETLSVINEHITDMSGQRTSYANGNKRETVSSVYSSQPLNRSSFIAGHETDEEESNLYTEAEVMSWSARRVAEYLEDNGVEKSHCDAFLEQEISGDVLLAMEQSSVFMKEFDLGPVGRRLRTWHKIKALQDEVMRNQRVGVALSTSEYSAGGAQDDPPEEEPRDIGRARSTSAASALPQGLSTRQSIDGKASAMHSYQQPPSSAGARVSGAMSPLQSMTSFARPESTYRPSAQNIRTMNHSRRHSSMGSVDSSFNAKDTALRSGHRKQPSFDAKWQPGQAQASNNRASSSHAYTMSSDTPRPDLTRQISEGDVTASPSEMEKGYFSSNETEQRSRWAKPTVLQKKSFSSSGFGPTTKSPTSPGMPSGRLSDATSAINSKFASFRTTSMPQFHEKPLVAEENTTPIVTKLNYDSAPSVGNANSSSPVKPGSDTSSTAPTKSPPLASQLPFFITKSKVKGLRARSDAVTTQEKTAASPTKEDSPARTGSSTPSTDQPSIDGPKSATRTSTGSGSGNLMPPPPSTKRPQRKNKKETSAYTRGLMQRTPAEQIPDADYSGWMKKKSGSLMTTWKPRLFVLKGRRLSYYYSETDTEEKGLIDISFHNVMVAHGEKLTGLHAAMTGAGNNAPLSPKDSATFTSAQKDLQDNPPQAGTEDDGLFIFKLVPPKSGRGVTFTKPTVHYFAVNSRQEGRLWMAALMKAVIDREQDGVVTTTYNQKTISLAKARERRERPPALKDDEAGAGANTPIELDATGESTGAAPGSTNGQGLGIEGLGAEANTGAERESLAGSSKATDMYSTAPSSAATGTDGETDTALSAKEREAVALNLPG